MTPLVVYTNHNIYYIFFSIVLRLITLLPYIIDATLHPCT